MSDAFEVTDRNRIRRVAKNANYDKDQVHAVIDAALIGHVAIQDASGVSVIPMLHARNGDKLLFHGATSSRLMKVLGGGQPVSVSFALVDGLVLAKSLFHHSMNYRSAVVFGRGHTVEDDDERLSALKTLSDKIMPGRWEDARDPSVQEMKATAVIQLKIESASAKVRTGGPADEKEDLGLPVWSGVLPLHRVYHEPVADEYSRDIPAPEYFEGLPGSSF